MTLRILQASDIHEENSKSLDKYKYLRDIANQQGAEIVFLNGDLFLTQELVRVQRVQQKASMRMMRWTDSSDRSTMGLYETVKRNGGMEGMLNVINSPELEEEKREEMKKLFKTVQRNIPKINAMLHKYENLMKFNDKLLKKDMEKVKEEINKKAGERFKRLDRILSEIKAPVYFVRGNWETDNFVNYDWKKPKILEKQGVVDIKGVKFAGAPNVYEILPGMQGFYTYERDFAHGGYTQQFENLIEEQGTDEEREQWENGVIPQRFVEETETYNRLKGKQFDVLVTHKGPHRLAIDQDKGIEAGSGIGLEAVISQVKPKVIMAGHMHGKGFLIKEQLGPYSYQGVRSSDETFYVLDMDTNSKQISPNGVLPYRWAKEVKYKAA